MTRPMHRVLKNKHAGSSCMVKVLRNDRSDTLLNCLHQNRFKLVKEVKYDRCDTLLSGHPFSCKLIKKVRGNGADTVLNFD